MFKFLRKFITYSDAEQKKHGWDWAQEQGVTRAQLYLDSSTDHSSFNEGVGAFIRYHNAVNGIKPRYMTGSGRIYSSVPPARNIDELIKNSQLNAASEIRLMLLDQVGDAPFYNQVDDLICDWYSERMKHGPSVDV